MNFSKLIIHIIFTWFLFTPVYAQDSEIKNKLHNYLNVLNSQKGFSGEILVAKGENILFQEANGLASIENNVELNKGVKYRTASITKTFN